MATERTFVLLKPDAVQRRLVGELYDRFERKGLKTVGLKMLQVTKELAQKHYEEHLERPFYPLLEEFITSGPVIAIAAEGPEAISVVRYISVFDRPDSEIVVQTEGLVDL